MTGPQPRYDRPKLRSDVLGTVERQAQLGSWDWIPKKNDLRWSENLFRIFGLEPGEITPTPEYFQEHIHPDDRAVMEQSVESLRKGNELAPIDYRFIRGDGSVRNLRTTMVVVERQGDGAHRLVGTVQDLTDQKLAEAEIAGHVASQHRAQRLESIGELAGGIAHDFNNLLAVIRSNSELALEGAGESGGVSADEAQLMREELADVRDAATHAAKLTDQLLVFARRELAARELVDLNEVVLGIERHLARTIGEQIDLQVRTTDGLPLVLTDKNQMEQVLLNLAINARDAMPAGGTLRVSIELVELDGECAHAIVEPGKHVRLTVADDGTGMRPEIVARALEPYFTTKAAGGGTGLGLATVYGIVKTANGDISIESAENAGTVVRVHLPLASAGSERSKAPEAIEQERRGGGEWILVTEDDDRVRDLVSRVLTRGGYRVITASGGTEALGILRSGDPPVGLLLTDVVMPGMPGTELAERMRVLAPDTPVLLMSGYTDKPTPNGSPERLIQKPFTNSALLSSVADALHPG